MGGVFRVISTEGRNLKFRLLAESGFLAPLVERDSKWHCDTASDAGGGGVAGCWKL